MKVKRLLFAVSAFFVLAGCTQKRENAAAEAGPEAAPPRPVSVPGVILTDTAKWVEKSEGLMAYAAPAGWGEEVEVLLARDEGTGPEQKYVTKRAAREKIEGERDFYQIKDSEGKEYWVQDLFIAVDAVPCIVNGIPTPLLYTKPDLGALNPNTLVLPKYALLGLHEAESTKDFVCVSGYITETEFKNSPVIARQFVKRVRVSANATDIQAMKLYKAAMANKDYIVKRELLNNALALNPFFPRLIQDALEEMNAPQFTERPSSRTAFVDGGGHGEKVNLRDKPGLRDSTVLAPLPHGTAVTISAETTETDTIDNATGYWYRIESEGGWEGWIFGAYLNFSE
jgi:hypothetical protein